MNKKYFSMLWTLWLGISVVNAAQPGDRAPDCPALSKSSTGDMLLANRGKVIYLDFWATWCPPCRKSMPALNQLRNELLSSNFEVIAINVDEDPDSAEQYLKNHPVDYPIVLDPSGNCPSTYQLIGMPTSYLLDQNGVIHDVQVGYRKGDIKIIRAKVMALLELKE